jgi:hypothetical protein
MKHGFKMSDTPRTDAATIKATAKCLDYSCTDFKPMVPAETARQLERELGEAAKDKARLDWMAGQVQIQVYEDACSRHMGKTVWRLERFDALHAQNCGCLLLAGTGPTIRQAIDAAMEGI